MQNKPITVLYDHQIFSLQKYGGVSRYYAELMKQFSRGKEVNVDLAIKYSENEYLQGLISFPDSINRFKLPIVHNKVRYALNLANSIKIINLENYDIFHPTYYDAYYMKYIHQKPVVITVYDLIHEKFPEYFSNTSRHYTMKKKVLARADKIIAISEQTKADILKYYEVDSNKIEVIYLASSIACSVPLYDFKRSFKYILYVGGRNGYKNFSNFIEAAHTILKSDKGLKVVCFGGGGFTKSEMVKFSSMGILNQMVQTQGSDEMLVQYYKKAEAFVLPSLYEGFGIPVLEAMGCGCPTLVSNAGSLPEVGGNATVYFNPQDPESITDAIERVIYSTKKQEELKDMGYRQNSKFNWRITADKTYNVYRSLL